MRSVICTLFEGHYHYGGAALINSLYNNGFRGDFFIGYRGELPFWAATAKDVTNEQGYSSKVVAIGEGLNVHFVPAESEYHLTNYKPEFMLLVMERYAKEAAGIFYFDPDIVNKCKWAFYEKWITYGAAVVHEIINVDVTPNHPKRCAWKELIVSSGRKVERDLYHYINGGFCGVSRNNLEFLQTWADIIKIGIKSYGMDMNYFGKVTDQTDLFPAGDQDALNISAMCSKSPVSEFGPEGMDFIGGGWLMSHATGRPKPWKKKFIRNAFKGRSATLAEKGYWRNVNGPIVLYSKSEISLKAFELKVTALINRFYRK